MKRAAAFMMMVMCGAPQQEVTSPAAVPTPSATASTAASAAPARARDYNDELGDFFLRRWAVPAGAGDRCAVFQVAINNTMVIWHVRASPIRSSGDARFDESVHAMLQKLVDDRAPLPAPPDDLAESIRLRTVNLAFKASALRPLAGC